MSQAPARARVSSSDDATVPPAETSAADPLSLSTALQGTLRALLRARVELALVVQGIAASALLLQHGQRGEARLALLVSLAAAALGLAFLLRTGELQLALRCPRLDALSVAPGTSALPWAPLRAADAALRTLAEDGGALGDFFPEARRELAGAAVRAIEAHRLLARAARHLARAPDGAGQLLLARQRLSAERELLALTSTLRDLRARFAAATAPLQREPDALPGLAALARRSDALLAATQEVQGAAPASRSVAPGERS